MSRFKQQDNLLGQANSFMEVLEQVSAIAPLNKPVLVIGERGTGKELIAARLHFLSKRWEQNYVKLNCAALSDSLLESELFGYEAGAFTGAAKRREGRFEYADTGTLFLDELANTSALVQEKLLRVIEYGEFERVGGTRSVKVDVRLVAATNEDLIEKLVYIKKPVDDKDYCDGLIVLKKIGSDFGIKQKYLCLRINVYSDLNKRSYESILIKCPDELKPMGC